MPFSDPILAGETLVRTAIASADYTVDNDGAISGWRIARDGSAEFRNVTIGGTAYTIDNEGNAAVETLDVNTAITLAGEDLATRLDGFPRGIVAYGDSKAWTVNSAAITTTATILAEFDWGPALNARYYRVTWEFSLLGSVAGDVFNVDVRYTTDGSTPTTSSAIMDGLYDNVRIDTTNSAGNRVRMSTTYSGIADYDKIRMVITLDRVSGTGNASLLATDDNAACIVTVEDLGLQSVAVSGASFAQKSKASGTPDPDPVSTYTKTYAATWSRSYQGDDDTYETNGTLAQGYYSSTNGNMKSWIGFDYSQIQSDLTGATVKKVEVYLYFWHWYSMAGGTAILGYHNSTATSAPAYDSSKDAVDEKRVSGWGRNVGKWVDITSSGLFTASGWKTGAHRGIVIGPGPSTSTTYYGKAYGNTEANEPKLRITYEK